MVNLIPYVTDLILNFVRFHQYFYFKNLVYYNNDHFRHNRRRRYVFLQLKEQCGSNQCVVVAFRMIILFYLDLSSWLYERKHCEKSLLKPSRRE